MRRTARALVLATAVSALISATALANVGGAAAVPLNNGQETTDAKFGGSGSFSWWVDGGDICYELSVRRLTSAAFAAHIHGVAGRTEAAGIVVGLVPPAEATGTNSDCVGVEAGLLAAIVANPGNYYVNVHTTAFPGGEVRGQLK
jgi:hypothetical protein